MPALNPRTPSRRDDLGHVGVKGNLEAQLQRAHMIGGVEIQIVYQATTGSLQQ
jgi:hypothetical protein